MTIASAYQITYGDLYNSVVNGIKNMCANVGTSLSSAVPTSLRTGYSNSYSYSSLTSRESLSDSNLNLVTTETIQTQLDSFLSSRGLQAKASQVMTLKGIIAFYNNIAVFLAARVKVAASDSSRIKGGTNRCIYYLSSSSIDYASMPYEDSQTLNSGEAQTSVTNLYNAITNTSNLYFARYSYSFTSSCCSSSSCSSCSCSSSSCSMFIAYMKL